MVLKNSCDLRGTVLSLVALKSFTINQIPSGKFTLPIVTFITTRILLTPNTNLSDVEDQEVF